MHIHKLHWKYCMYFHCTSWLGSQLRGTGETYVRGCGKTIPFSSPYEALHGWHCNHNGKKSETESLNLFGNWNMMMCKAPWDECTTVHTKFVVYGRERANGHLMQQFRGGWKARVCYKFGATELYIHMHVWHRGNSLHCIYGQ